MTDLLSLQPPPGGVQITDYVPLVRPTSGGQAAALYGAPWPAIGGPSGGDSSASIIAALGYIPYSAANPAGYLTSTALAGYATTSSVTASISAALAGLSIPTNTNQLVNGAGFVTNTALAGLATASSVTAEATARQTAIAALATVANSGSYTDLLNKPTIPAAYALPIASSTVLGGVKQGANITIAVDGTISAQASSSYTLPAATSSTLGGVKASATIAIAGDGTATLGQNGATTGQVPQWNGSTWVPNTVATGGTSYVLPTAASGVLGGIKVGAGLAIDGSGVLSASYSYTLPTAGTATLGGVKVDGTTITINGSGVISGTGTTYTGTTPIVVSGSTISATVGTGANTLAAGNDPRIVGAAQAASLATVATSGSYADLSNKPTIPSITYGTTAGTSAQGNDSRIVGALQAANNLSDLASPVAARTALGLGTAATAAASAFDVAGAATAATATAAQRANNLADLANVATARTNLGLSTAAASGSYADLSNKPTAASLGAEVTANKGASNGYASLDSTGHVPTSQIPAAVQGALNYQGAWNASTNSPALASGTGTKGFYYTVSTAGTTTLDGVSSWTVGDHVAYSGTAWEKFDGVGSEVLTVAGRTGNITLAVADVSGALSAANNLSDVGNAATVRTNLGLGSAATQPSSAFDAAGAAAAVGAKVGISTPVRTITSGATATMLASDGVLLVNKATGSATGVALEGSPVTGATHIVKDGKGDAATNNITITPASGTVDGASSFALAVNRASVTLVYTGAEWSII